jgi:hypothetical protein
MVGGCEHVLMAVNIVLSLKGANSILEFRGSHSMKIAHYACVHAGQHNLCLQRVPQEKAFSADRWRLPHEDLVLNGSTVRVEEARAG